MMAALTLLVGLLGGAAIGVAWSRRRPMRRHTPPGSRRSSTARGPAVSIDHVIELARRALQASAVCLVGRELDSVIARGEIGFDNAPIDRAVSLARLAMADGRQHVVRDHRCTVAVADEGLAVAAILPAGDPSNDVLASVSSDLRKLLGELQTTRGDQAATSPDGVALPARLDTLPAIASALCDRARYITGRSSAVVLRDPDSEIATVISVSTNADRRLKGITVSPESAAGRACLVDGIITAASTNDLFGRPTRDRRRRVETGTAYPLRDGGYGIGALVVFGPHDLDDATTERVIRLAGDVAPQFAAASAVQAAEERATRDNLTGLPNRVALERAMANASLPCAILCVDIDHFKRINDTHGHAAGDGALKHLAGLFQAALRDGDIAARTGGEEFVLWLPGTPRESALDVAERLRGSIEEAVWIWSGKRIDLTCSIGVAAVPETTT
ncbi:MAG: GGDEF domain-containing protein, partial [Gemmatimonadetes bacterium]|nr:GGDEF domain-containing protein [Gemmatimonadota bacterium]